jgi:hypothetical protein
MRHECEGIRTSGYWKGAGCGAVGKFYVNGKWWCKNHMPIEADTWIKIGTIGVDAGMCWIGDPCYIVRLPHTKNSKFEDLAALPDSPKEFGEDWKDFCNNFWDKQEKSKEPAVQFNYDKGHPGLGICTSTGYGDGEYDVFIKKNKEGRVAELKVVFIDEEKEND